MKIKKIVVAILIVSMLSNSFSTAIANGLNLSGIKESLISENEKNKYYDDIINENSEEENSEISSISYVDKENIDEDVIDENQYDEEAEAEAEAEEKETKVEEKETDQKQSIAESQSNEEENKENKESAEKEEVATFSSVKEEEVAVEEVAAEEEVVEEEAEIEKATFSNANNNEEEIATYSIVDIPIKATNSDMVLTGDGTSGYTVDFVEFNKTGHVLVYISYPPNDPAYAITDSTDFDAGAEPMYVYNNMYDDHHIERITVTSVYQPMSNKTYDNTKGEAILDFDFSGAFFSGVGDFQNYLINYQGYNMGFFTLKIFGTDYSDQFKPVIGQSRYHTWTSDWMEGWKVLRETQDVDYKNEVLVQSFRNLKKVEVINSSEAQRMLSIYSYNKYCLYFNDKLDMTVISDHKDSTDPYYNTVYFIMDQGEKIKFDGENSTRLFAGTNIINVNWEKIGTINNGTAEGLTTLESWYEGVNFVNNDAETLNLTLPRLDLFKWLDMSNVTSMKNMFKNSADVTTSSDGGHSVDGTQMDNITKQSMPNLVDISGMFEGVGFNNKARNDSVFNKILHLLDTSNVTNMSRLFKNSYFIDIDYIQQKHIFNFRDIDLSNVTNISEAFMNTDFYYVDINEDNFDVSKVTNDTNLFTGSIHLTGETGAKLSSWYIENSIEFARRDTYNYPGLFRDTLKSTGLISIIITSAAKSGSTYTHKGEFPLHTIEKVYKGTLENRTVTLPGFRDGDNFQFYKAQGDIYTYPRIGDNCFYKNNSFYTGDDGTSEKIYVCVGYEDASGNALTYDEVNQTITPFTVDINGTNEIIIIWEETNKTATFKSQYRLPGDKKVYFIQGRKIVPISNFKKNQIIKESNNYYKFLYWEKEGTTGEYDFENTIENDNVTFNAVWQQASGYTVSFVETQNKYNVEDQFVESGTKAKKPDVPATNEVVYDASTKKTFLYWYENDENVAFDFENTNITKNTTLYSKWYLETATYTVKFTSEHLGPYPDQQIVYGQKVVDNMGLEVDTIYKDGTKYYRFKGWKNSSNQSIDIAITQDMEFTAEWEQVTGSFVEITFMSTRGNLPTEVRYVTINDDPNDITNSLPHYEFIEDTDGKVYMFREYLLDPNDRYSRNFYNWFYDAVNGYETFENKTFYAYWEDVDSNYGIVKYQSQYGNLNPEKKFIKWSYDTYIIVSSYTGTETEEEIYYQPTSPRVGDKIIENGKQYILQKWQVKGDFESDFVDVDLDRYDYNLYDLMESDSSNDLIFKAIWTEVRPVVVTFTNTHGVAIARQILDMGDVATEPTELVQNQAVEENGIYYRFDYWALSTDPYNQYDFSQPVSTDLTIQAQWYSNPWIEIKYQSTYNSSRLPYTKEVYTSNLPYNLTELNSEYFKKDVTIVTDSGKTYKFRYWYATQSTIPYTFPQTITKSITLTAYWEEIEMVTLNYVSDSSVLQTTSIRVNNKAVQSQQVEKGKGIKTYLPTYPAIGYQGYNYSSSRYSKLIGWRYLDDNNVEQVVTDATNEISFNKDTTFTTKWDVQKQAVFDGVHQTPLNEYQNWYNSDYAGNGKILNKPTNFSEDVTEYRDTLNKKLYRFKYWYATDSNVQFDFTKPVYDDIRIIALWEELEFFWDVTLELYPSSRYEGLLDGNESKVYKVKDGETFVIPYIMGTCYKSIGYNDYNEYYGTSPSGESFVITSDKTITLYLRTIDISLLKNVKFHSDYIWTNDENLMVRQGNTIPVPNAINIGEEYIDTATGKKYEMKGWYDSTDATKTIVTFPQTIQDDIRFIALWEEQSERRVKFKDDYKATPPEIIIMSGNIITRPTTHMAGEADIIVGSETYRFDDWYEVGALTPFDFTQGITNDITIEARYTNVTQYTIDYDIQMSGEEAKTPTSEIVVWGSRLTEPTTIAKGYIRKELLNGVLNKAYRFDYWYSTNSNIEYDFVNCVVKNQFTMKGHWTELSIYDVTFNAIYVANPENQKIIYGDKATTPSNINTSTLWERRNAQNVVVEAHRFKYWYEIDDAVAFDFENTSITHTTNLTATWSTIPIYTVRFDDPTGHIAGSILKTYPTLPITIEGIRDNEKIATPNVIKIGEVVKVSDGGSGFNYYKFNGWYDGTTKFNFDSDVITADTTLNAVWEPYAGSIVTFSYNGHFPSNTVPAPQTSYPDVPISEPTEIHRGDTSREMGADGHNHIWTFEYWYVDGEDENVPFVFPTNPADNPTHNITLIPKYIDTKQNDITFNGGGIIPNPPSQEVPEGGIIIRPKSPTNPNVDYPADNEEVTHTDGHTYKFNYWYSTDSNVPYDFNTPVIDNTELNIRWTDVTPWTVTFNVFHGTGVSSQTVINGDKATIPNTPNVGYVHVDVNQTTGERTAAYRFVKWYEQGDTTEATFDFENTNILRDYNLEAKWDSIPLYNVTFADPDGRLTASILPTGLTIPAAKRGLYQGEKVATPTVINIGQVIKISSTEYFKFKGWHNGTTLYNFDAGVTADTTLNAVWEPYAGSIVTFSYNGHFPSNTVPAPQTSYPDVPISEPTEIHRGDTSREMGADGHYHIWTFEYWYVDGEDENVPFVFPTNPADNPTHNITLIPKYIDTKQNDITFNGGGIIPNPPSQEVPEGGIIIRPKSPTNPNVDYPADNEEVTHTDGHVYKFNYWYSTDSNVPYDFNTPVIDNTELNIRWTDVTPWTVTFEPGKNYTIQSRIVINGNTVTSINSPTTGTLYEPKDSHGVRTEASRFEYWFLSTDITETQYDFNTPITADITLKGKWSDLPLRSITFEDSSNVFVNEDTTHIRVLPAQIQGKIDGETIPEPTIIHINDVVKTRDNVFHKFTGWKVKPVNPRDIPYDFTQPITGSINLDATWEEIVAHRITYQSLYVNPSKRIEYVEDGNRITPPTSPAVNQEAEYDKNIYKFEYWYATNSNMRFDFTKNINSSYDLTAKWVFVRRDNSKTPSNNNGGGGSSSTPIPGANNEPTAGPTAPNNQPKIDPNAPNNVPPESKKDEEVEEIEKYLNNEKVDVVNIPGVDTVALKELYNLRHSENKQNNVSIDGVKRWHKISRKVWYCTKDNFGLVLGWNFDEQDKQMYYLDPETGIMAVGWTNIDGNYYYFSEEPQSNNWYKFENDWTTRHYNDKSIGSMYKGEVTPDGHIVDANGKLVLNTTSIPNTNQNNELSVAQSSVNVFQSIPKEEGFKAGALNSKIIWSKN